MLANCALGQKFSAKVAGYKMQLYTPSPAPEEENTNDSNKKANFQRNLGMPKIAKSYLSRTAAIYWGSVWSSNPNGEVIAEVNHVFATFLGISHDDEVFSKKVHETNQSWLLNFDSFLRIISNQKLKSSVRMVQKYHSCLRLYGVTSKKSLTPPAQDIKIYLSDIKIKRHATKNDLKTAINLCSRGKVLALQYQLLLRACDAHQENDMRNVVIEAATALEVAATRRIRSEMKKSKATDKHIELMLDGHRMLRNRIDLLKKMGVVIPIKPNEIKTVLDLRNKVIHGGHKVNDSEAIQLLTKVEHIIRDITPEFAVDPT